MCSELIRYVKLLIENLKGPQIDFNQKFRIFNLLHAGNCTFFLAEIKDIHNPPEAVEQCMYEALNMLPERIPDKKLRELFLNVTINRGWFKRECEFLCNTSDFLNFCTYYFGERDWNLNSISAEVIKLNE
jgi:hypothetical protein